MPMIHVLFVNMADLWTALRSLGLPSKTSSCEVNALTIKNTDEHNVNSVLEGSEIITRHWQRTL